MKKQEIDKDVQQFDIVSKEPYDKDNLKWKKQNSPFHIEDNGTPINFSNKMN